MGCSAMIFFDALAALINLDLGFFINAIAENFIWFFGFLVMIYFLVEKKNVVYYFLVFIPYIWIFLHFEEISGVNLSLFGVLIWVVARIVLTNFGESIPFIKKNFIYIWEPFVYILLLLLTFGLVGT